ncbi:hypothetical protein GCM10020218_104990 [Dactylosporangium vinaceum]
MLDVPDERVDGGLVGAEEDAHAGDADDAAGLGARPGLLVGDVARVVPHRAHARVAVDDRLLGVRAQVQAGPDAAVRAVGHHARGVHLAQQVAAVGGEALVDRVEAAVAGGVAGVVGGQHGAHAEVVELPDPVETAFEGAGVLQVERDGHPAVGDVADARRGPQHVRGGDPGGPGRDEPGHVRIAVRGIADVDGYVGTARALIALGLTERGLLRQRQAAVLLPQNHLELLGEEGDDQCRVTEWSLRR